jgi:hypothetical protein
MMIAPAVRSGLLLLVCFLASGCAANKRADAVAKAEPYITEALTRPMPDLYDRAVNGSDARDWLYYSLALASGRPSPVPVTSSDRARLAALDARLQSAKRAWLKDNPPGSENEVPWPIQIGLTGEDAVVIERVEQAISADYWLSRAEADRTLKFSYNNGKYGQSAGVPVATIDDNVLLTASACAMALRVRAGLPETPVPEVVRRLGDRTVRDIGAELSAEAANSDYNGNHAVGRAACGSDATFDQYAAVLRRGR